jgi:hypothetical protein
MRPRRTAALLGIAALLVLASACTRSEIGIESPAGPSTLSLTFALEANPNVLLATTERPSAVIKGTVRRNGEPAVNVPVYFTVLSGPGEFDEYLTRAMALTDSTGTARVTYYGPSSDELFADTTVLIKGQPETSGSDYVHKTIEVRVLKGD